MLWHSWKHSSRLPCIVRFLRGLIRESWPRRPLRRYEATLEGAARGSGELPYKRPTVCQHRGVRVSRPPLVSVQRPSWSCAEVLFTNDR